MKFFLIGAYERLTEDFNSSTLLWRTLQALLSMCRAAVVEGVQVRRLWRLEVFGPKVHVLPQPLLDYFCGVCMRTILLEYVVCISSYSSHPRQDFRDKNIFVSSSGQPVATWEPHWRHLFSIRCHVSKHHHRGRMLRSVTQRCLDRSSECLTDIRLTLRSLAISDFLWNARSRAKTTNYLGSTNNLQIGYIALLFSYYKKYSICCKKNTYISGNKSVTELQNNPVYMCVCVCVCPSKINIYFEDSQPD